MTVAVAVTESATVTCTEMATDRYAVIRQSHVGTRTALYLSVRIDFHARYNDIQRLLRASDKPNSDASRVEGFEDQLRTSTEENTNRTDELPGPKSLLPSEPKASLGPLGPKLLEPAFQPMNPPQVEDKPVNEVQVSVKIPTVVDVKRFELSSDEIAPVTGHSLGDKGDLRELIKAAGVKKGISPELAMAVVQQESAFDPRAISSDGHASKGLFQLLDSTGRDLQNRFGVPGEYDPYNPEMNVELGTGYLKYLHHAFSEPTEIGKRFTTKAAANPSSLEKIAVAAFNAGEGRVASAQARAEKHGKNPGLYDDIASYLPASTRQYVSRVISTKENS